VCTDNKALEVAEKLELLQEYPRGGKARAAIAELIGELCSSDASADKLFHAACREFNAWPGPEAFVSFARRLLQPAAQRPELREWAPPEDWGRVPGECDRCRDDGYVRDANGVFVRCGCDAGRKMDGRFLKLLNDNRTSPGPHENRPIRTDAPIKPTAAAIARVMREKRERKAK
jgi:hypothetical protein